MSSYHKPVLLNESIEALNIKEDGVYVDCTYGGGGHSNEIMTKISDQGKLICFDQDETAFRNEDSLENKILINANFRYLRKYLDFHGIEKVDGIIADLGMSSYQINTKERGFSFMGDSQLDMRMNINGGSKASDLVNNLEKDELVNIFSKYGEIKNSKSLVNTILLNRGKKKIMTTQDLIEAIDFNIPKRGDYKYLAKVFQALRIAVNDELAALRDLLTQSVMSMNTGARLVILSYHSLEDSLVKYFIKTGDFNGSPESDIYGNTQRPFKHLGKMIKPSVEEINQNSRARSAKLRIAERL